MSLAMVHEYINENSNSHPLGFFSITQTALMLNISEPTLYRYKKSGKIKSKHLKVRNSKNTTWFSMDSMLKYLKEHSGLELSEAEAFIADNRKNNNI